MVSQRGAGEPGMPVAQRVGLKEQSAVIAAEHQDMALPDSDAGSRHRRTRQIRTPPPLAGRRRELPRIRQELEVAFVFPPAAHHVHAIVVSVVLVDGQIERPGFAGPGVQRLPAELVRLILLRQVQGPEVLHGRVQPLPALTACQIDDLSDQRSLAVSARLRQGRTIGASNPSGRRIPGEEKHVA